MGRSIVSQSEQYGLPTLASIPLPPAQEMADFFGGYRTTSGLMKRADPTPPPGPGGITTPGPNLKSPGTGSGGGSPTGGWASIGGGSGEIGGLGPDPVVKNALPNLAQPKSEGSVWNGAPQNSMPLNRGPAQHESRRYGAGGQPRIGDPSHIAPPTNQVPSSFDAGPGGEGFASKITPPGPVLPGGPGSGPSQGPGSQDPASQMGFTSSFRQAAGGDVVPGISTGPGPGPSAMVPGLQGNNKIGPGLAAGGMDQGFGFNPGGGQSGGIGMPHGSAPQQKQAPGGSDLTRDPLNDPGHPPPVDRPGPPGGAGGGSGKALFPDLGGDVQRSPIMPESSRRWYL